jgi:hypothetical protein
MLGRFRILRKIQSNFSKELAMNLIVTRRTWRIDQYTECGWLIYAMFTLLR